MKVNGRTERACYERRARGERWQDIGAVFWKNIPREWKGSGGAWRALKASCAASRYAHRTHKAWPIRRTA